MSLVLFGFSRSALEFTGGPTPFATSTADDPAAAYPFCKPCHEPDNVQDGGMASPIL